MQSSAMLIPTLVWWSDADAGETKQWSEYKRPAKRGRYKSGARNGVSTDLSSWWVHVGVGVHRAPTWDCPLLLIDRCLYWLWPCGLRDGALYCCLVLAWACQPAVPLEASAVWCSPCVLWYAAYLVMAKVWCCKPATTDQLAFCASQYIHSSELLHLSYYTIRVLRLKD